MSKKNSIIVWKHAEDAFQVVPPKGSWGGKVHETNTVFVTYWITGTSGYPVCEQEIIQGANKKEQVRIDHI